jgi:hypothetical protein
MEFQEKHQFEYMYVKRHRVTEGRSAMRSAPDHALMHIEVQSHCLYIDDDVGISYPLIKERGSIPRFLLIPFAISVCRFYSVDITQLSLPILSISMSFTVSLIHFMISETEFTLCLEARDVQSPSLQAESR